MAVNEDLTAYSTTAISNTPSGSDNIGTELDDHLRDIKKNMAWLVSNSRGETAPGNIRGRLWFDSSATSSSTQVLKLGNGGSKWGTIATINTVTGETFCPANPIDFASTGTTLTAGGGLSGGGTLAANRSFSIANTGLTATTTYTNTTVVLDPFGRVISAESGTRPSGPSTRGELVDETGSATYVSPSRAKHIPGVAKAWVDFDASGTASIGSSYNIASVVRSGVGLYTINFTTGFNDTFYVVSGSVQNGVGLKGLQVRAKAVGSVAVSIVSQSPLFTDAERAHVALFGYFPDGT
jgi:hypothetical protein